MGLVPAQASASALVGEEGPQLVIPAVETSIRCSLIPCMGSRLPPQSLSFRPLCPTVLGEDGQAGGPSSPLREHQPMSGSPHTSRRDCVASGLKTAHCPDSVRGREWKGVETEDGWHLHLLC